MSSPAALLFALFSALLFLTALLGLLPIPNLIDRLMEYVAQALPMDAASGVDLVGIDARVVVASLETYRKYEEVNLLERLLRV